MINKRGDVYSIFTLLIIIASIFFIGQASLNLYNAHIQNEASTYYTEALAKLIHCKNNAEIFKTVEEGFECLREVDRLRTKGDKILEKEIKIKWVVR